MELAKCFSAHYRPDQPIGETVRLAIRSVGAFADSCGLSPAASTRLAIVVDELIGNLLRHGRPGCDVRLNLFLGRAGNGSDGGDVVVVLEDDCLPFDPREAPFDGPGVESGGGVGLALVRAFTEISAYERHGGRNRLILRLPGSAAVGVAPG